MFKFDNINTDEMLKIKYGMNFVSSGYESGLNYVKYETDDSNHLFVQLGQNKLVFCCSYKKLSGLEESIQDKLV